MHTLPALPRPPHSTQTPQAASLSASPPFCSSPPSWRPSCWRCHCPSQYAPLRWAWPSLPACPPGAQCYSPAVAECKDGSMPWNDNPGSSSPSKVLMDRAQELIPQCPLPLQEDGPAKAARMEKHPRCKYTSTPSLLLVVVVALTARPMPDASGPAPTCSSCPACATATAPCSLSSGISMTGQCGGNIALAILLTIATNVLSECVCPCVPLALLLLPCVVPLMSGGRHPIHPQQCPGCRLSPLTPYVHGHAAVPGHPTQQ